jgi:hypothetical protein
VGLISIASSLLASEKQRQQRYPNKHLAGQSPLTRHPTHPASHPPRSSSQVPPPHSSQSLEDYIRFSMLVSLSQQHDPSGQAVTLPSPLSTPLPPPTDADNRLLTNTSLAVSSFGPHDGLLLSANPSALSGTGGMLSMRSPMVLPTPPEAPSILGPGSQPTPQSQVILGQSQMQSQGQGTQLAISHPPSQSPHIVSFAKDKSV